MENKTEVKLIRYILVAESRADIENFTVDPEVLQKQFNDADTETIVTQDCEVVPFDKFPELFNGGNLSINSESHYIGFINIEAVTTYKLTKS